MLKALFLDRDGIINYDFGYVYKISEFKFVAGIFDLCHKALEKGYIIIVITNQSGIERGYFSVKDFEVVNNYMLDEFKKQGIDITDVFFCPFLNHLDRKPSPAMFLKARDKYEIDMTLSVSVGDKERDMEAGSKAGVGKNLLVSSASVEDNSYADKVLVSLEDVLKEL